MTKLTYSLVIEALDEQSDKEAGASGDVDHRHTPSDQCECEYYATREVAMVRMK
jgi:hypothetical protein